MNSTSNQSDRRTGVINQVNSRQSQDQAAAQTNISSKQRQEGAVQAIKIANEAVNYLNGNMAEYDRSSMAKQGRGSDVP